MFYVSIYIKCDESGKDFLTTLTFEVVILSNRFQRICPLLKKKEKNKLLIKQCLNFIIDLFWVMGILNPPPTLISNEYHMSTSI